MGIRACLGVTTIFDSDIINKYAENFSRFGHLDNVKIFVIPDRKTPKELYQRCYTLKGNGVNISIPTLDEQESFLNRVGLNPRFIPFNSDNRRNVG